MGTPQIILVLKPRVTWGFPVQEAPILKIQQVNVYFTFRTRIYCTKNQQHGGMNSKTYRDIINDDYKLLRN